VPQTDGFWRQLFYRSKYKAPILKKFTLKNSIQIIFALSIGAICVSYVISSFDWRQIWILAKKVNYFFFFLSVSATLFAYFLVRTIRWRLLLSGENIEISFGKLYLYSAIAIGLSTVTPFQAGEALKVELLLKYGGKRVSGYAIFLLERIFDFFTVLVLAIIGIGIVVDFGISQSYLLLVGTLAILLILGTISLIYLIPARGFDQVRLLLESIWQRKCNVFFALVLTIISWFVVILGWNIALSYFSINLNILQSISVVSITTLVAVVSFVPGAVGVSEISVATLLNNLGIEESLAQAGAIAIRVYAFVILVLTFLHWLTLKYIKHSGAGTKG